MLGPVIISIFTSRSNKISSNLLKVLLKRDYFKMTKTTKAKAPPKRKASKKKAIAIKK